MKRLQSVFFLTLLTLLSVHSNGQTGGLEKYKAYIKDSLKTWVSIFNNFNLADFQKSKTESFEDIDVADFDGLKDFYSVYKPLLTFSPDQKKFIDIDSYQLNLEKKGKKFIADPEIDQVICLCDLKRKQWNRILFKGSDNWIEEVCWVSNTKFILAGIQNDSADNRRPEIYIGDTGLRTFELYKSRNRKCIQKPKRYRSAKFAKMNIIGL